MKLLQLGLHKSGNFWLYNILNRAMKAAGQEWLRFGHLHPIYPLYRNWKDLSFPEQPDIDLVDVTERGYFYCIQAVFWERIDDLDDFVAKTSHGCTHSNWWDPWTPQLIRKFDKSIYILRDPRDALISFAHFQFMPYLQRYSPTLLGRDQAEVLAGQMPRWPVEWVEHVAHHLLAREALGIYFVTYEHLRHDFEREFDRMLEYLELDLPRAVRQEIAEAVHYKTMKKENPGHVRKGETGGWREVLTEDQKRVTRRIAGPMLDLLGYPLGEEATDRLPRVPDSIDPGRIHQALEAAHAIPLDAFLEDVVGRLEAIRHRLVEVGQAPTAAHLERMIDIGRGVLSASRT